MGQVVHLRRKFTFGFLDNLLISFIKFILIMSLILLTIAPCCTCASVRVKKSPEKVDFHVLISRSDYVLRLDNRRRLIGHKLDTSHGAARLSDLGINRIFATVRRTTSRLDRKKSLVHIGLRFNTNDVPHALLLCVTKDNEVKVRIRNWRHLSNKSCKWSLINKRDLMKRQRARKRKRRHQRSRSRRTSRKRVGSGRRAVTRMPSVSKSGKTRKNLVGFKSTKTHQFLALNLDGSVTLSSKLIYISEFLIKSSSDRRLKRK